MDRPFVYMDNNATTPLHPEVKKTLASALDLYGNPSSLHGPGREAREAIEDARARTAAFLGAKTEEIFFTGSGSEGNNTVLSLLRGEEDISPLGKRRDLVTTVIEHPCILSTAKNLEAHGHNVVYLSVDRHGRIDLEELRKTLTKTTGLVSIMFANNEIGTVQDIAEAARITHEAGALFHTDAVQAVGKLPINVHKLGIDFLTLSAHKIYGPKGIGAVFAREKLPFKPYILGGHQEYGRRAGTENTLGIIGLGAAIAMREQEMEDEEKRLLQLKNQLREGLQVAIPDVLFLGHPEHCLPGTLNASFAGVEGEAILLYLDLEGIAVSTGSACASGSLDPSHVILSTGVPVENAHGSVRISLGRENTEADIHYMLDKLPATIDRLRAMSTVYRRK